MPPKGNNMSAETFAIKSFLHDNSDNFALLMAEWIEKVIKPGQEVKRTRARIKPAVPKGTSANVAKTRTHLPSILAHVHYTHTPHTLKRHGKPYAAIISNVQGNRLEAAEDILTRFNGMAQIVDGPAKGENFERVLPIFLNCFKFVADAVQDPEPEAA